MARNPPPAVTKQAALVGTGTQVERQGSKQAPLPVVVASKGQQREAPPSNMKLDAPSGIGAPRSEKPRNLQPSLVGAPAVSVQAPHPRSKAQTQQQAQLVPQAVPRSKPQQPQKQGTQPVPPTPTVTSQPAKDAAPPELTQPPVAEEEAQPPAAKPRPILVSRVFGRPVKTFTDKPASE